MHHQRLAYMDKNYMLIIAWFIHTDIYDELGEGSA